MRVVILNIDISSSSKELEYKLEKVSFYYKKYSDSILVLVTYKKYSEQLENWLANYLNRISLEDNKWTMDEASIMSINRIIMNLEEEFPEIALRLMGCIGLRNILIQF